MDAVKTFGEQIFASLKIRNYRLYFLGIGFSHIGNWMQTVALGWLVLELSGSGTLLGGLLALRFAPLLFGGIWGGMIVDRFDKRQLLYATQSIAGLVALFLGMLIISGGIELWMVYGAALLFGCADVVDRPARQTFLHEMVGPENLQNAVALNSTEANLARTLGPLFAGVLIASVGIAVCFFANALSFLAFIVFLFMMRSDELHHEPHDRDKVEHVLDGLRYVASKPMIRTILIAMAVIGTLSYEFQTSLPLLARTTFLGGAPDYAALLSAMGAGSVVGGILSAGRKRIGVHEFVLWAFLFGVSMCLTAAMPSLGFAIVAMVFVGIFSIAMSSTGNTIVQLESAPHTRGRVMALWTMALFGSTLIGAPLIGFIGEHASPRLALAIGGVAALAAAFYAHRQLLLGYRFFAIPGFISIRRGEASIDDTKV